MKQLEYDIVTICRRCKSGGAATQAQRKRNLLQIAVWLTAKHPDLKSANLRSLHVQFVVNQICTEKSTKSGEVLGSGRQKNLLSSLRWLLERLGKSGLLPRSNDALGIPRRNYVPATTRAVAVEDGLIANLAQHCEFTAMSLLLTREFGLRIEEAHKFRPCEADCGTHVALRGSWCKGGVPRTIPIRTQSQRAALDEAARVAGNGSLIPSGLSYIKHARSARELLASVGVNRIHGARHQYAQTRFAELAGFPCPLLGGPTVDAMTVQERLANKAARLTVSKELGHGRVSVTNVYLGSATRRQAQPKADRELNRLLG